MEKPSDEHDWNQWVVLRPFDHLTYVGKNMTLADAKSKMRELLLQLEGTPDAS